MLSRLRPYVLLFLGLNVVYHSNLRPVDSGDSLPASLIPFSVVLDQSVTLDRFAPWLKANVWYSRSVIQAAHGHYFSHYPIGGPLLASPLYLPIAFLGLRTWDPGTLATFARIAQKLTASAIAALSAVVLLALLKRITNVRWAWCLTLVYALATETWSISSQALWQHGPGELAIIASLYGLERWRVDRSRERWLLLSGGCAAAAFAIRPTNIVLVFALVAALWAAHASITQQIRLLLAPVIMGPLLGAYNWYVFQRLSGGYAVTPVKGSILLDFAGLLLSPARSEEHT